MENRFASNIVTFETKAPKSVQEKWAAFPLKWKIDLPQTYFFNFETKAPEIVQENGQH